MNVNLKPFEIPSACWGTAVLIEIYQLLLLISIVQAGIYLLKVNNRYTRTKCEICSKLTIKMPLASFWYLYCQLWTYFTPCSSVSIVNFEHVIVGWCITMMKLTYVVFLTNLFHFRLFPIFICIFIYIYLYIFIFFKLFFKRYQ